MYLSLGNVLVNPQIGMLLIDFLAEKPERMRIEGTATITEHDELAWEYPGAQFVVRVHVHRLFPNCPRYIHRMALVERSPYVPRRGVKTPVPDEPASSQRRRAKERARRRTNPPARRLRHSIGRSWPAPARSPNRSPPRPPQIRGAPAPLHGGPLVLLRFMREHRMLTLALREARRALAVAEAALPRAPVDRRAVLRLPGVTIEIGKDAKLHLGRWSWIGHGSKIRVHEGEAHIGAKSVLGQECTISAFQHVSIGASASSPTA